MILSVRGRRCYLPIYLSAWIYGYCYGAFVFRYWITMLMYVWVGMFMAGDLLPYTPSVFFFVCHICI